MKMRGMLTLSLACAFLLAPWAQALSIGDQAPPITITDWIKNPQTTVFDNTRVTALEFWSSGCHTCQDSIRHMTTIQTQFKDSVRLVSLASDDPSTLAAFVSEWGNIMNYSVASLPDWNIWSDYGVSSIPYMVIVNQAGRVVWTMDSPGDFGEQVAAAVNAMVVFKYGLPSRLANQGEDITYTVTMVNNTPVNFAWTRNGVPVGGNSPTLTLTNVTDADEGSYVCTASKADEPEVQQRTETSLIVASEGEGLPATSPFTMAVLMGALSFGGACILMKKSLPGIAVPARSNPRN